MLAHVKWFVEDPGRFPVEWGRLVSLPVLAGVALGLALAVALGWLQQRVEPRRLVEWARRVLLPWLPLLLSVHLGISLIAYGLTRRYLAPSLPLPDGGWGTALAALELVVAAMLTLGLFTRLAAGLLVLSGPIGMLFFGFVPILERVELLGIALYLAVAGRRRWSLDALRLGRSETRVTPFEPLAVASLRIAAGVALVAGALTEKLLAPAASEAFLARHDSFNVLAGLGVSDRGFAEIAGAIELALGVVLLTGLGTRLAVLVALVPFNVTLLFFGWRELVGHLPIYGVFLVLLVEGSGRLSSGTGGSSRSSVPRP